jgi:hypothetical protein
MTETNNTPNVARTPSDSKADDGHLDLPPGEPLGIGSLGEVLRRVPARVIVIGGTQKTGKTTLIASIYERFRLGPFAGMNFAGSRTLMGFEMICHLGRLESGRETPETERTKLSSGWQVFHLSVGDLHHRRDLLLADMSGEAYESVRDFGETSSELGLVQRADHFVLLLDGAKLSDVRERHSVYDDSHTILRRLVESRQLSPGTHVTVAFSKWDVVELQENQANAKPFCEQVETRMRDCFQHTLKDLHFARVIARDDRVGGRPATQGVAELFEGWCVKERVIAASEVGDVPLCRRWIDKYGWTATA